MKLWKRTLPLLLATALALTLLTGCASGAKTEEDDGLYIDEVVMEEIEIEDEAVPLAVSPAAVNDLLLPTAAGTAVESNSRAMIDYSNIQDGYVMVQFTGSSEKRLVSQVTGPSTTYTYYLKAGVWATFPLSDGNGKYTVTVLENTTDKKYAQVLAASFNVTLKDEFAPFIRPNQYVNYGAAPKTVAKAKDVVGSEKDPLKQVELVYNYVVKNLTYDKKKAASVSSGYLPDLDAVLAAKTGICFDYAAMMTGMLRSQGVPCKLVVGYAGKQYHAWVSVWTKETGWIDGVIYFNGTSWQRMDPTFASSANSSDAIMKYIGDGKNYSVKYVY